MQSSTRKVALIVEEDPALQRALSEQTARLDIDVVVARDYYSAISELEAHSPDLVVVSLLLPNESGYDLCEYIRRERAMTDVPIVVTCEGPSIEDQANAEEAGASVLLKKPFTMQEFGASVAALLDGAGPISSAAGRT